jgi:hypothetical protein
MMEKSAELIAAEKALQDYFDGLDGDEKVRALAYQEHLETMASMTGSMSKAIQLELTRQATTLNMSLVGAAMVGHTALTERAIRQAMQRTSP